MKFTNLSVYRLIGERPDFSVLEDGLRGSAFIRCSATQEESTGFYPPRGEKNGALAEAVGGHWFFRVRTETKGIPSAIVREHVEGAIEKYKQETGRERASAKLKKEFKEEAIQKLLPVAFPRQRDCNVWIDPKAMLAYVDTTSPSRAAKALGRLSESAAGMAFAPYQSATNPAHAMAYWLVNREPPPLFTIDRDCVLKMPDDQKSAVRYSRHTLEIDEVIQHVRAGKLPVSLGMTWNNRVSFVLDEDAGITGIKLLDIVLEVGADATEKADAFDADAAIISGELSKLFDDLNDALGGHAQMALGDAPPEASDLDEGAQPQAAASTPLPEPTDGSADPMYDQALEIVRSNQKASISLVQRHLKLGYNRAARLLEMMEIAGAVTSMDSMGARRVVGAAA